MVLPALRESSRERLLQVEQMKATSVRNWPRQPDIQAELSFFHCKVTQIGFLIPLDLSQRLVS